MNEFKSADAGQLLSLAKYGFCTFHLTKEQQEDEKYEVGQLVEFLPPNPKEDDLFSTINHAGRLVAIQKNPDGGCTLIFAAAVTSLRFWK